MRLRRIAFRAAVLAVCSASCLHAQTAAPSDSSGALAAALTAACRQDASAFAAYLAAPNASAFRALPADQQTALLKRFVLLDNPGKVLLSTSSAGHPVMRCDAGGDVSEMRFGPTEAGDNLSFIRIEIPQAPPEARSVRFGLVRESAGWKLLSVGLLLLDIPAMQQQWQEADLAQRESQAIAALRKIAAALKSYQRSFGKLPETLAPLGPAGTEGISPDHANLVDASLAAAETPDYRFRYTIVPPSAGPTGGSGGGPIGGSDDESDRNKAAGFALAATPVEHATTGRRSFYLDATEVLRGADHQGAVATVTDPRIGDSTFDAPGP